MGEAKQRFRLSADDSVDRDPDTAARTARAAAPAATSPSLSATAPVTDGGSRPGVAPNEAHATSAHAVVLRERRPWGIAIRYLFPFVATGAALLLSMLFESYISRAVFVLFWPAVLATAIFAGLGPSLVASVLSVVIVDYWFIPPRGMPSVSPADLVTIAIFFLPSVIVSTLSDQRRLAELRAADAARANADLARRIEEHATEIESQLEDSQAMAEELEQMAVELEHRSQEAEAANQAKSQFLAAMSHELRTPLNAIGGYTQLLAMGVRGPVTDEQRVDLARIEQSQRHLLGLINDVLDFARIEAGRVEYHLAPVPVPALLSELEDFVRPQLRDRTLEFHCDRPDDGVAVLADPDKARQILLNLLSNAVKFTPAKGRIDVRCDEQDGRVRIHVRDTGVGIAPDRLQSVFEPFVQAHRSLIEPTGGVGLGLAISRDLARAMQGDLRVDSSIGKGSTFTLDLPSATNRR